MSICKLFPLWEKLRKIPIDKCLKCWHKSTLLMSPNTRSNHNNERDFEWGSVPTWFRIEQCLNCRVPGINPPQFYEKKRTTFAIQRTDFVVSPQVFLFNSKNISEWKLAVERLGYELYILNGKMIKGLARLSTNLLQLYLKLRIFFFPQGNKVSILI